MIDIAGSRGWSECKRVLNPKSMFVIVGGPSTNRWLGPLSHSAAMSLATLRVSQNVVPFFLAQLDNANLTFLQSLLETGKVRPILAAT